jgi:flavin reductase (DIM6/NTAB) family NADH-FMN oxidoreductase RutF
MYFDLKKVTAHQSYNLLIGLIVPRPIALITSQDVEGRLNAAPYSAYGYLCVDPPIIGIGVGNRPARELVGKDTARNIRNTHEFVVNVVTEDIVQAMNICAVDFPPGVNELDMAGLTTEASTMVSVPRIKEAHAAMECREYNTIEIGRSRIILGEVLAIYIEDAFVDPKGPYIRTEDLQVVGRMNGLGNYVKTRDAFMSITRINYDNWQKGKQGEDPEKPAS